MKQRDLCVTANIYGIIVHEHRISVLGVVTQASN